MGRVEAVIFAAPSPMPRVALARLVGSICNLDDLIADIRDELRARPHEFVFVPSGYQLRTKPRFAQAIRAASGDDLRDAGAPELTPLRAPQSGVPFANATTKRFLEVFGLATLRELPDIERLEDQGLLQQPRTEAELDGAFAFAARMAERPCRFAAVALGGAGRT